MKNTKYLKFIRDNHCIVCNYKETEAHHVRIDSNAGVGIKPDDYYAIPLCRLHHLELHHFGKDTFFGRHNIDPYKTMFKLIKRYLTHRR